MKSLYLNKITVFLVLWHLCFTYSYAQVIDTTTLIAKVMLVTKYTSEDKKPIAAISITFVNTSERDIYIPELFNKNRTIPLGGKVKRFYMENGKYIHMGNIGKSLPWEPTWGNTISGSRNEIIDKYHDFSVKKANTQDSILHNFAQKDKTAIKRSGLEPLFLKAHEAYEINLIKDVDYLVRLPGEYKLFYELEFSLTDKSPYPKEIEGYQLFIPTKMISNILYVKVEP